VARGEASARVEVEARDGLSIAERRRAARLAQREAEKAASAPETSGATDAVTQEEEN